MDELGSATNELHGSQGAKKKDCWNSKSVESKPTDRENRVIPRRCGDGSLSHGLFQANVKLGLAVVSLTHDWCPAFCGLEVGIGTRCSEGVVSETG